MDQKEKKCGDYSGWFLILFISSCMACDNSEKTKNQTREIEKKVQSIELKLNELTKK